MARILVLDDDSDLCAYLGDILRGEGHAVECAVAFEDARVKLEGRGYDLVICDHRLWDGHHDEELRPNFPPNIPVLFCTASGDLPEHRLTDRPCAYVRKPFANDTLLDNVKQLLSEIPKKSVP